jgi:hypothetical protein
MPININGTTVTGGTTVTITDSSGNKIYGQNAGGIIDMPQTSNGSTLIPMFNVGMGTDTWRDLGGIVIFNYTGGSGYMNVGSCYNTSNGRFTAPWTGIYLFKHHIYCYGPNGSEYTWYFHPLYLVNGSSTTRRPGGTPYRIRQYGLYASYGQDSDCCELIYCIAGDYVEVYTPRGGTMQGYPPYSAYSGAYLGN